MNDQTKDKKQECRDVKQIVESPLFWKDVAFCIDAFTPLVVTLKIFDQSSALAGYVRHLWSLLSESVAINFGKHIANHIPLQVKEEILTTLEDSFLSECSHVFDAAYVLNPHFATEVRLLAASRDIIDQAEWSDLHESATSILKLVIARDLQERGEIANLNTVVREVHQELLDYSLQLGKFSNSLDFDQASPAETIWMQYEQSSRLRIYAIIILNIAHSVANVERNHKITSLIHTSKRATLGHVMVDQLTRGNLAYRAQSLGNAKPFTPANYEKLTKLTDSEEAALEVWTMQQQDAVKQTSNTMSIAVSLEQSHGAQGDPAARHHVSDNEEIETGDVELECDLEEDPDSHSQLEPRKSRFGRTITLPKKYRDARSQFQAAKTPE